MAARRGVRVNEDNHETPVCAICGDRIGVHNDASIILRGQFFMNKAEGYAMFVLDPDTKFVNLELENALGPGQHQLAMIVDHNNPDPIVPVHSDCLNDQITIEGDEEEDELDDDELDADMRDAMDRDHNPFWDDNDMLRGTGR